MAAGSPTAPPVPPGAISVYTPEISTSVPAPSISEIVGTTGIAPAVPRPAARTVVIGRRPEGNDGIWINFMGARWVGAGAAALNAASFAHIGEYAGFPDLRIYEFTNCEVSKSVNS